jgi:hypothetical protein
LSIND